MTRTRRRQARSWALMHWMGLVAACAVGLTLVRDRPWLLAGLAGFVALSGPPLCGVSRRRAGRPLGVAGGIVVGAFLLTLACGLLAASVWLVVPEGFIHFWAVAGLGPAALAGGLYGALLEGIGGVATRRLDGRACRPDPRDDPALRPYLGPTPPVADGPPP